MKISNHPVLKKTLGVLVWGAPQKYVFAQRKLLPEKLFVLSIASAIAGREQDLMKKGAVITAPEVRSRFRIRKRRGKRRRGGGGVAASAGRHAELA